MSDRSRKGGPDWEAIRAKRQREQARRDPVRYARNAVYCALSRGEITRGPCAHADASCKGPIEAHHESYALADWLKVTWLCRSHHARVDYVYTRERYKYQKRKPSKVFRKCTSTSAAREAK